MFRTQGKRTGPFSNPFHILSAIAILSGAVLPLLLLVEGGFAPDLEANWIVPTGSSFAWMLVFYLAGLSACCLLQFLNGFLRGRQT